MDGAEGALDGDGAGGETFGTAVVDGDVEVLGPAGTFEVDPFVFVCL